MHLGQPDGERKAGAKHRVRKAIGRHVGRGTARHAIGVQDGALGDHLNHRRVVVGKAEGLLPNFIAAAKELAALGADGITTNCGFLSLYQKQLAASVAVPVATSSLMQVPFVERLLPPGKRVGILTVSARSLTADHLRAAGVDPGVPVIGTDGGREFTRVLIGNDLRVEAAVALTDLGRYVTVDVRAF